MNILNKGIKYNLPLNNKDQIIQEIISAETAVKTISDPKIQTEARILINNKFNNVLKNRNHTLGIQPSHILQKHVRFSKEFKLLKQIKAKLIDNNAFITKADKGNTLVVMDNDVYTTKVNDFISNNNIRVLNSDPTDIYVKSLNNKINKCVNLFNKHTRRYLKPCNAKAPELTGLPKI